MNPFTLTALLVALLLGLLAVFCVLCHFAWFGLGCSLAAGLLVHLAGKADEADLDDDEEGD
jgi:hypothetical protein